MGEESNVRLQEKHRAVLLQRSRYGCWLAITIVPTTIISYNYFFYPNAVIPGILVSLICDFVSLLVLWSLRTSFIKRNYHLPLFIMFTFVTNFAATANFQLTGDNAGNFFFPYFLIYFAIGLFYPGHLRWVLLCYICQLGSYIGVEYVLGHPIISTEVASSRLIWLIDTAVIGFFGNRAFTFFFMRDMRNQIALEDANEKLQELDKAKNRFFSNITHEFRTPLVALSSTLQLMRDQSIADPKLQDRLIETSQEALGDMLENVNDLLTKTRSEKGMLEMRWSKIDIAPFIEKSLNVFEPIAAKQHNRLRFTNRLRNSPQDGKPLHLYADRTKLKKILNNLIGNAMKFTQGGVIEVILDVRNSPQPPLILRGGEDGVCILQVRDTGLGIPQQDLPTIFDPFTQARNNPFREAQGTGLGLSMVKDFAEAHHGTVAVESTLGKGSCFTVALPLGNAHANTTEITELFGDETTQTIHTRIQSFDEVDFTPFLDHHSERAHLLLVEDNPRVLQMIAYVLKDSYNLHFARDGQDGLEKAETIKPQLIVSDIMMPRMNGYEFVHAIKGHRLLKYTPVILLTSKSDSDSKVMGFEKGADDYLAKPFSNRELLARIKYLLKKKTEQDRLHRELKVTQQGLLQADKLSTIGLLSSGVAHEINNPCCAISMSLTCAIETLDEDNYSREELKEHLTLARDANDLVKDIAASLLSYARKSSTEGSLSCDIQKSIDATLTLLKYRIRASKVLIHFQKRDGLPLIRADTGALNHVFANLIQNAIQAECQNIYIDLDYDGPTLTIKIRDDGSGIDAAHLPHIFDAFFTTKEDGKGTGLGLNIVKKIVEENQGKIQVQSTLGRGTEFEMQYSLDH